MAEDAVQASAPTAIKVELGARSYEILIGRGLIGGVGAELQRRLPGARIAIVNVAHIDRRMPQQR